MAVGADLRLKLCTPPLQQLHIFPIRIGAHDPFQVMRLPSGVARAPHNPDTPHTPRAPCAPHLGGMPRRLRVRGSRLKFWRRAPAHADAAFAVLVLRGRRAAAVRRGRRARRLLNHVLPLLAEHTRCWLLRIAR